MFCYFTTLLLLKTQIKPIFSELLISVNSLYNLLCSSPTDTCSLLFLATFYGCWLAAILNYNLVLLTIYIFIWFGFSSVQCAAWGHKASGPLLFLPIFVISCCSMFAKQLLLFFYQIFPLLSSPLFCRRWNCPSPYII